MDSNYSGPKNDIDPVYLDRYEETGLWVLEPKMDGMWIQFETSESGNIIASRQGIKPNDKHIKDINIPLLLPHGTILCGELVAGTDRATKMHKGIYPMYIFDMIQFGGDSLRQDSYEARRSKLESVFQDILFGSMHIPGLFNLVPSFDNSFRARYEWVIKHGGEGVVLKRVGAKYSPGKTEDMIRCKEWLTDDFVLMELGKTDSGDVTGVWGQYHNGELIYVMRAQPRSDMSVLQPHNCGTLVAEFKGCGRQSSGTLRSAQFVRVRNDKPREECVLQNTGGKLPTRKK